MSTKYNARTLECGAHRGKGIAVITSGGDSQGMNAALRGAVRTAIYLGCNVFFVREGYQGLVDNQITQATWEAVSGIINKGGTVIGSARCKEFHNREGRLKAAINLLSLGIFNLIIIGGDGSLTGANIFKNEWQSLLEELSKDEVLRPLCSSASKSLNIVGIVGSIDNDFCGTDMTIGTDSALHRIVESVDAIACTAYSHQRTFIMEVMGRHCGYLAISAGLLCGACAVFAPEEPAYDWEDDLCTTLEKERRAGQRLSLIIVSEGAIDRNGETITSEMVKDVVVKRLNYDTRITVLGHVQRGGNPSAFDRIIGSRMGAEAVVSLMEAQPGSEAMVLTLRGTDMVLLPLMDCVKQTQEVTKAMKEKNWDLAVELRGRAFQRRFETYKIMHSYEKEKKITILGSQTIYNIAVIHIGAPACGMNSTVRAFVRACIQHNCTVYGISEGIDGLLRGDFHKMKWSDVIGWVGEGGALLGTKRTLPKGKFEEIAKEFLQYDIQALLIIGGFEAYQSAIDFFYQRRNFNEFCIPIMVIPATISNNVPGADYSLGCDTALNEIVEICDRMKQSAQGTKRRVFIAETMGGYCGYLATLAGIAGAADAAYIYEEKFALKDLQRDLYNMASKMCSGVQRGLILRNERCNENYNCDFMKRLYAEEGKGVFTVRSNIIGHMQQGGRSSPFDRNMGITLGLKAMNWFMKTLEANTIDKKVVTKSEDTVVVFGLWKNYYNATPVAQLIKETNFDPFRIFVWG